MKTSTRALSVLISLGFLLFSLPGFGDAGDPPNRVARLSYIDGAVSFEPSGENDWSQASLNYPLTTGDRVWTDKGARAEVETGNIAIRLNEQTDLTATSLTDRLIQLGLAQGTVRVRTYDLRSGNQLEIDTPNGALSILQAGNYRIEVYPDQNQTIVVVNSGQLQVSGNGVDQTLQGGQAAQLTGTDPIQVSEVSVPGNDGFDQWSGQRDGLYARSRSREYVSPEVPGYYDLDQYGGWNTVPEYGPVWYPSSVPVGWSPYRYGRWAWVEPWGWTWVDNEPWGFAPFHYGRWVQVGPRWGWLPGPIAVAPVYGPAFVAFIGGGGFSAGFAVGGVTAWFPLGPGEPYYPSYHHSDNYLRQVNVTNVRNVTNITNITNVTNVNNVNYRYRTVGATAMPANAFRSSEPVQRNMVKVTPQQFARAQVIPHPDAAPAPRAIAAGAPPAKTPNVRPRPLVVQHTPVGHPAQPVANAGHGNPAPAPHPTEPTPPNKTAAVTPHTAPAPPQRAVPEPAKPEPPKTTAETPHSVPAPPERNVPTPPNPHSVPAPRENPPAPTAANERGNAGHNNPPAAAPPANRPALISKNPPPQENVPFQQKQPALQQHPGRPLEPQQSQNLHTGQPAGPMQDKEFPAHPAPAPARSAPAPHPPASHPAPPPKSESKH